MKNNKLLIATSLIVLLTTGTVGTISTTQNILANDKESTQTTQKAPEKPGNGGQGAPGKPGEGGFGGSGTVNQGSSANTIESDEDKKRRSSFGCVKGRRRQIWRFTDVERICRLI